MAFLKPQLILIQKGGDQPVASTEKSSFSVKSEVLSNDEYEDTINMNPSDMGQPNMSVADAYKMSRFPLVSYEDYDDKADNEELNVKVEEEDSLLLEGGDRPVASTEKSSFSSFKCTICSKTFQLQRYLNAHLETHSSEQTHPTEDFKCTICSKTFQLQRYLKAHLKIHSGKQRRPTDVFKCTICSKTFQFQRYLNAHLKIHTSEQTHSTHNFKCTICSKTFLLRGYLNAHLKTHSSERMMQCDHCKQRFKTIRTLKKHLKNKHVHGETNSTTFLCSICNKQFRARRYLTNHLKTHGFLKPHLIREGGDQPVASTEKSSFSVKSEVLSNDEYEDTIDDMNPSGMGQANMSLADAYKRSRFPLVTYEDHDDKADNEELYMNVEEEDSLLPDDPNNSASVSSFQILPLESSCDMKVEEEDSLLPDDPDNSASVSSFQILPLESSCVVKKSVDPVSLKQKAEKKKLTFDVSGVDPDLEYFKGFLSLVKELSSKRKRQLFASFAQELFRHLDEQEKEETDSTDI
ncbi:zinc finger protein 236-like [Biomphalaria glabrata]|uniref:Zinc finger protein 236-like n=1 Tax=Biomphalaria glabrata TaxID=6526 RepID=A0A9W2YQ57_BIOGL|nr:zinc finger protein 236-like [Biomphalaria glabrata]XP_055864844.1 zinc finger protein 236-like [Biomphalaria glabrata]XP_055864845.1 zinc finger protein 236-like [Biomphalaria glabrata]XP_055864846.1 zinc finger protein 236-like [Biomphalaria glabrata]XP_055864847.1 zinc finger protein 236-like [Biomphalaria glabrata]XP_055864848.1 zinc finger protein 236-like [Biomphalaria glabrata]XP_055864849.1 zinc finger protein 236-like [Biomphalaria glabrata]XP_055864850.1 zinc finger protein 236-